MPETETRVSDLERQVGELHRYIVGDASHTGLARKFDFFKETVEKDLDSLRSEVGEARKEQQKFGNLLTGNGNIASGLVYRVTKVEEQVAVFDGIKRQVNKAVILGVIPLGGILATVLTMLYLMVKDGL